MNKELLSNKLKEVREAIEKLNNKKTLIKNVYEKDIKNTSKYYNEKISKLEDLRNKKVSEIREKENLEIEKINNEKAPFQEIEKGILEKFKLFDIKENLNDVEVKYNGWCREQIETLRIEDLNLIKIGSFTGENRNKPINKFDLRIQIHFKNQKVKDFINVRDWQGLIFEKSFKTKEECKNYFKKNYEKIVEEFKKSDLDLFKKINEIKINLNEEFDFNLIKAYSHQWQLIQKDKNKASFISSYSDEKRFEVEYLGNRKFKISNEEEKRELELSLEYSAYNFTPEIIV